MEPECITALRELLKEKLKDKKGIIEDVKNEGTFTKNYLPDIFEKTFGNGKFVIEGINSKGRTTYKNKFFGVTLCPDFVVNEKITLVGEIK